MSASAHAGLLERIFAPQPDRWAYWEEADSKSTHMVDHSPWQVFLDAYVVKGDDGVNRVRYGSVTSADKKTLERYIESLRDVSVRRLSKAQQLAYWINLYNALTVNTVLKHYPVRSIRDIDISPGLFSDGPWGKKLLTIEGQDVSLNDIEHRILRPIWRDPRVHYALNCASLGCPNLAMRAYDALTVEQQMNEAARVFVNSPRGVSIREGRLRVSSIYEWFRDDFGRNDSEVIEHLRKYASPALANRLTGVNGIYDDSYDWALNDASRH
ncbi:MAG: DUF547 domain-containing protein [Chromatiales bacterium]|nr:DUF547 domain-containing protein [Chromatiales bacterium]